MKLDWLLCHQYKDLDLNRYNVRRAEIPISPHSGIDPQPAYLVPAEIIRLLNSQPLLSLDVTIVPESGLSLGTRGHMEQQRVFVAASTELVGISHEAGRLAPVGGQGLDQVEGNGVVAVAGAAGCGGCVSGYTGGRIIYCIDDMSCYMEEAQFKIIMILYQGDVTNLPCFIHSWALQEITKICRFCAQSTFFQFSGVELDLRRKMFWF